MEIDKQADALYTRLADSSIEETIEPNDNIFADLDATSNAVGLEFINLSICVTL